MGHYDAIRERSDAERDRRGRQSALIEVCHRLASGLGKAAPESPTIGDMLRLKAEARQRRAELDSAITSGDIVFDAMLTFGEVVAKSTSGNK